MRWIGDLLTLLVAVSALGLAAVAAGVALDAWWSRCEALEWRGPSPHEGRHDADAA
jgi:hypothetical protein